MNKERWLLIAEERKGDRKSLRRWLWAWRVFGVLWLIYSAPMFVPPIVVGGLVLAVVGCLVVGYFYFCTCYYLRKLDKVEDGDKDS